MYYPTSPYDARRESLFDSKSSDRHNLESDYRSLKQKFVDVQGEKNKLQKECDILKKFLMELLEEEIIAYKSFVVEASTSVSISSSEKEEGKKRMKITHTFNKRPEHKFKLGIWTVSGFAVTVQKEEHVLVLKPEFEEEMKSRREKFENVKSELQAMNYDIAQLKDLVIPKEWQITATKYLFEFCIEKGSKPLALMKKHNLT